MQRFANTVGKLWWPHTVRRRRLAVYSARQRTLFRTPKGNPRYKGLLEGQHSLIKNELAEAPVAGILDGGGSLERNQNYLVWINPFDAFTAYVADLKGRFIGTARVAPKVCYADQEAIERELEKADAPALEDLPGADVTDAVEDIPAEDLPL